MVRTGSAVQIRSSAPLGKKMKANKTVNWFKKYAEFIFYFIAIIVIMLWQWRFYGEVVRVHQDLIIAAFALQILNITLAVLTARRMRLLSQLLLVTAILFGAVVIYYLKVIIANVI